MERRFLGRCGSSAEFIRLCFIFFGKEQKGLDTVFI